MQDDCNAQTSSTGFERGLLLQHNHVFTKQFGDVNNVTFNKTNLILLYNKRQPILLICTLFVIVFWFSMFILWGGSGFTSLLLCLVGISRTVGQMNTILTPTHRSSMFFFFVLLCAWIHCWLFLQLVVLILSMQTPLDEYFPNLNLATTLLTLCLATTNVWYIP